MSEVEFLQSYVAPILRYRETETGAWVENLHGTGFLVSEDGYFISARHVIEAVLADVALHGGNAGIFPMRRQNGVLTSLAAPSLRYEHAPVPHDVTIFQTPYRAQTVFRLQERDVEVWQDVATMGYPISATHKAPEIYEVQQRAHKGYVQRKVPQSRLKTGKHPDIFELSFAVTHGLSGSPLFIHHGSYDIAIGVCVGSLNSRVVDYENTVTEYDSTILREKTVRVEEFGIAHDIRPLLGWRPACLNGKSLAELSS